VGQGYEEEGRGGRQGEAAHVDCVGTRWGKEVGRGRRCCDDGLMIVKADKAAAVCLYIHTYMDRFSNDYAGSKQAGKG